MSARGAHFAKRPVPSLARRLATGAFLAALVAAGAVPALSSTAGASGSGQQTHYGPNGETDVNACSTAVPAGTARCFARVRTDATARNEVPLPHGRPGPSGTIGNNGAYDPSYLQSAYNAPSTLGAGQTVAIVDAYDDPYAQSDLNFYRSSFGLPACGSGCFTKLNENGGTSYPRSDSGWSQEISLDLDMVSAMCPNCHILLIEAASATYTDLGTAVNTAVRLGANAVSNSYGGSESTGEDSLSNQYYNHPGVAVTVSSGDNGYGVEFPAASPLVTAVGGTSLQQATATGTRNATETTWSGAGSGCSAYEAKPSWQHDSGCSRRTVADVSAVADPNTGVWVRYANTWYVFGGTSVASPIVASVYALAGNAASSNTLASYPYGTTSALNDVVSGSNGSCSVPYLCTAMSGYDGPTGLGTPSGTTAFAPSGPPPPPTAPSAPQNLTAIAGNQSVALSWSPPSSGGSVTYNIYRNGSTTPLASGVSSTSYTDTGLTNGVTYTYAVSAVNSANQEGPQSASAAATPVALSAPSAPQNLSATKARNRGINLSWSAPSSTGGSPVTGYQIWRSTTSGIETFYATSSCTTSTCSVRDNGTTSGQTYYYTVKATNSVGTGPASNEASAVAR